MQEKSCSWASIKCENAREIVCLNMYYAMQFHHWVNSIGNFTKHSNIFLYRHVVINSEECIHLVLYITKYKLILSPTILELYVT
jgi:hypothetical protein